MIGGMLFASAAAQAETFTGDVSVEIMEPLRISQTEGLHFGTIIPDANGGSIVIQRNSGACVAQQGLTLVGSDCQRGEFRVTGPDDQRVRITTDSAPITLTRQGGGATMTMDQVNINGSPDKRLDGSGELTFFVAGGLQVGGNQLEGVYDANFNVTVDWR
jgi:hypothetical protein